MFTRRGRRRVLRVEQLEARALLAAFVVNDPGDDPLGPNPHHDHTGQVHDDQGNPTGRTTLRSAITQINQDGGGSISFSGGLTISIGSALDTITAGGVTINGGQLGSVIIVGGGSYDGLVFSGGGATIQNLVINGFGGSGIALQSSGNTIKNCYIGIDSTGKSAAGNQIGVMDTGSGNTIRDCVISGNLQFGLWLRNAKKDQVFGNKIGTDKEGKTAVPNRQDGIYMSAQAAQNTIGGTTDSARNIISGNLRNGLTITCEGPVNNVILGNYIGVDVTGATALGNGLFGVVIQGGSIGNTVGGTTASARNIISGNKYYGVGLGQTGTSGNQIQGNYIGTDLTGTKAVPNGGSGGFGVGVFIGAGATNNTIGGSTAGARNIISGNQSWGVSIGDAGSSGNVIKGNYIGTDVNGTKALPNGDSWSSEGIGVLIANGATGNIVGGTNASDRNLISGNRDYGVRIRDANTSNNQVLGNDIGTDRSGSSALPNGTSGSGTTGAGVVIAGGATSNIIGGSSSGARNLIAGNQGDGVRIEGADSSQNRIQGNYIGTNRDGTAALANSGDGVRISDARNNTIGGSTAAAGNLIAGNTRNGVRISASNATTSNTVSANLIGVDRNSHALANGQSGVFLDGAGGNTIGGMNTGEANIIAGNTNEGILLAGDGASNNIIAGNWIGTNLNLDPVPNGGSGVFINAVSDNQIGGQGGTGNQGWNVIRYNNQSGVRIDGSKATGNLVASNDISFNQEDGILIHDAVENVVGMPGTGGSSNIVSGNGGAGIRINGADAQNNVIVNTWIGAAAAGSGQVGNGGSGILIEDASDTTIGGNDAGADNLIIGNTLNGITITGDGTGNAIRRNAIFANGRLGIDLNNDRITPVGPVSTTGPNHLQNYPVLNSITTDPFTGDMLVQGFLVGQPGTTYQIQFYANAGTNAWGLSEGQAFIGTASVTTDGAGRANINSAFPVPGLGDQFVTATATDRDGNTSEFSPCRDVLRGSVQFVTLPSGFEIEAFFHPTVYVSTLAEAARICGVDHFNWLQHITHVPDHWSVFTYLQTAAAPWNQQPTPDGKDSFWPAVPVPITPIGPPITDPSDHPPLQYGIHSALAAAADPVHFPAGMVAVEGPGPGQDTFPFYFNEDNGHATHLGDVSRYTSATQMIFYDAPRLPAPFYSPAGTGNFMSFETSLVGVFGDHTGVEWVGIRSNDGRTTSFRWSSNASFNTNPPYNNTGGIIGPAYLAVYEASSDLPAVSTGNISQTDYLDHAVSDSSPSQLTFTVTAAADVVSVGQPLTYTLTVTNTGPTAATGVTLADKIPAGVTIVSATPSQGSTSQSGNILTANIGTLAAGARASLTLVVKATATGLLTNVARASDATGTDPDNVLTVKTSVVPATPSAPTLLPADDTGTKGDSTTEVTSPRLTGKTTPNTTVRLIGAQDQVLGSTTSDGTGTYTVMVPGPLAPGSYALRVQVVDAQGIASPPSAPVTITVVNAPPPFRFSQPTYTIGENGKSITITITRTGDLSQAASVVLAPAGGTAISGKNYKFSSTVVKFSAKKSTATVKLTVIDDKIHHGDTTLILALTDPVKKTTLGTATVVITEKDPPPPVKVLDAQVVTGAGPNGQPQTSIVVSFSGPLTASGAQKLTNYRLVTAGVDKKFGTRDDKPITLGLAVYDADHRTVTLVIKGDAPAFPWQLKLTASGIKDAANQAIDGNKDGKAGGDAVLTLNAPAAGNASALSVSTPTTTSRTRPAILSRAVDHLFTSGGVLVRPTGLLN